MEIETTGLGGVLLLTPKRFGDARGSFTEVYSKRRLAEAGVSAEFVQDNLAVSLVRGVLRGLHYQGPPAAQAKLLQVVRGEIFDAVVDLRRGSATYGRSAWFRLSEEAGRQLFVPAGFAHGYMTLTDETVVLYKVDAFYAPELEGGVAWDDPALGIPWPGVEGGPVLSDRDRKWPGLAGVRSPF